VQRALNNCIRSRNGECVSSKSAHAVSWEMIIIRIARADVEGLPGMNQARNIKNLASDTIYRHRHNRDLPGPAGTSPGFVPKGRSPTLVVGSCEEL
jgi:hypothetical protein